MNVFSLVKCTSVKKQRAYAETVWQKQEGSTFLGANDLFRWFGLR